MAARNEPPPVAHFITRRVKEKNRRWGKLLPANTQSSQKNHSSKHVAITVKPIDRLMKLDLNTYQFSCCVLTRCGYSVLMSKVTKTFLIMIVEPQVRRFCGPLFFTSSTTTPKDNIQGSGSFGLVAIGNMKLLVTCWHVVYADNDGFKDKCSQNPALRFGIGFGGSHYVSLSLDDLLEKRVDDERRCDLLTFDVGDALDLVAASNLAFIDLNANPPLKVHVGDILYLIGFPAKGRVENETSVGFPRQPLAVQASQIGDFNFFARVINLKLDETDYAGISGAPCFIVRKDAAPRLVGFATGFAPNQMNMLQFTYARYIGQDGIIRYMA